VPGRHDASVTSGSYDTALSQFFACPIVTSISIKSGIAARGNRGFDSLHNQYFHSLKIKSLCVSAQRLIRLFEAFHQLPSCPTQPRSQRDSLVSILQALY
jgi:hypothetical protein